MVITRQCLRTFLQSFKNWTKAHYGSCSSEFYFNLCNVKKIHYKLITWWLNGFSVFFSQPFINKTIAVNNLNPKYKE